MMGILPPCSWCGRSCSCNSTPVTISTRSYSSGFERFRPPNSDYAEQLRKMRLDHYRALALAELRRADKAAARRAVLRARKSPPALPEREPQRNRVCSRAQFWRAA